MNTVFKIGKGWRLVWSLLLCSYAGYAQLPVASDSLQHNKRPPSFNLLRTMPAMPANRPPATLSLRASFFSPGFFCRQEVRLDRKLPVPFRFRLGSMQYCDWLEQKQAYRP
jgi:hypothetical protein